MVVCILGYTDSSGTCPEVDTVVQYLAVTLHASLAICIRYVVCELRARVYKASSQRGDVTSSQKAVCTFAQFPDLLKRRQHIRSTFSLRSSCLRIFCGGVAASFAVVITGRFVEVRLRFPRIRYIRKCPGNRSTREHHGVAM